MTYHTAEELLELTAPARKAFGLRRVHEHSTLWWANHHKLEPEVLRRVLEETVKRVGGKPEVVRRVALDSTGLWLPYCSRHFEGRRSGTEGRVRGWLKWAVTLWLEPQALLARRVRPGPCGDYPDLVPLSNAAYAAPPFDEMMADAGYDSEGNHRHCRGTLKVNSLVPAKGNGWTRVAKTPYRVEMCHKLGEPGDARSRRAHRQCWKVETVMSVSERLWGEALAARLDETQQRQALLLGAVYNLHRLVVLGAKEPEPFDRATRS